MFITSIISIFCLSRLSQANSFVPYKEWMCGNDDFTKQISYRAVNGTCPDALEELNHCCIVHDECYTNQMGRSLCDAAFCECGLTNVVGGNAAPCHSDAKRACKLVETWGADAYRDSEGTTASPDLVKHVPGRVLSSISDKFVQLYSLCPNTTASISSCASIFNNCEYDEIDCVDDFYQCLSIVSRVQSPDCKQTLSRFRSTVQNSTGSECVTTNNVTQTAQISGEGEYEIWYYWIPKEIDYSSLVPALVFLLIIVVGVMIYACTQRADEQEIQMRHIQSA